ncbi:hypothetical protein KW797_01370 [Candidatus Parcubacteria bacterium]|nr:hypothetical protein [Candidatus Parcubacteria bacterium]
MTDLPSIITEEQWLPDRVKFRRKCIDACLVENLTPDIITDPKRIAAAIFSIAEECFIMGEAFGGKTFTDEEVREMNRRAVDKIKSYNPSFNV